MEMFYMVFRKYTSLFFEEFSRNAVRMSQTYHPHLNQVLFYKFKINKKAPDFSEAFVVVTSTTQFHEHFIQDLKKLVYFQVDL
ncbi:hypothetical protein ASC72_08170 [Flavobacterium sp. Root420]|nr:hypothetical protein ASC72_08170 [Flavobacterium sp. Root420]